MPRPNIVLLTVDALRPDRLSANGYSRPTSPEIDHLIAKGWHAPVAYTLSSSTIGAFPSIMTSTRPLSFGGFDEGISARPPSISRTLSRAGYHTTHVSSVQWVSSHFGYTADAEIGLFSPKALEFAVGTVMQAVMMEFENGRISFSAAYAATHHAIDNFFATIRRNFGPAADSELESARRLAPQQFRWKALKAQIDDLEEFWLAEPERFLRLSSKSLRTSKSWLPGLDWAKLRSLGDVSELCVKRAMAAMSKHIAPRFSKRLDGWRKPYPDAKQLVDLVLKTAQARSEEGRPFFIWAHLFDTHIPYSFGSGRPWWKDGDKWLDDLGYRHGHFDPLAGFGPRPKCEAEFQSWSACYDGAVRFVDAQIGRLRRELDRGPFSDTLLVLASDHGEELGEHGGSSHVFLPFEHNVRIHLSAHHPSLSSLSVRGFATSMDIGPTILSLVNLDCPVGWEGRSLAQIDRDPPEHVLCESFFGSPCKFGERPIYFANRTGPWKLIWRERVDDRDIRSTSTTQLFELTRDPTEQHDLSDRYPAMVERLMIPILDRQSELMRGAPTVAVETAA